MRYVARVAKVQGNRGSGISFGRMTRREELGEEVCKWNGSRRRGRGRERTRKDAPLFRRTETNGETERSTIAVRSRSSSRFEFALRVRASSSAREIGKATRPRNDEINERNAVEDPDLRGASSRERTTATRMRSELPSSKGEGVSVGASSRDGRSNRSLLAISPDRFAERTLAEIKHDGRRDDVIRTDTEGSSQALTVNDHGGICPPLVLERRYHAGIVAR